MHRTFAHPGVALGPMYKRIKMQLTDSLASGQWQPNEALPSESRLAKQFHVSIGTIRKAIDELVAEKILVRQQGRGTFVASHTQDRFLYHFFHIVRDDGTKRFPSTRLLSFRKERSDDGIAQRLGLERGARVIHFRNLLTFEDQPIEVDDIYVSLERFEDLSRDTLLNRPGTIYQLYQERFGINVIRTSERLKAAAAVPDVAQLLAVKEAAPVLQIERTAFTYSDTPIELRRCVVNTQGHAYFNEMAKQP